MRLSEKQLQALKTLSEPYPFNNHHPIDAFDGRTIHSLEKRELVEFYRTSPLLHGAVRLTEAGKKMCNKFFNTSECNQMGESNMLFKLWSANKMKTFKSEEELNGFVSEKGLIDFVVLRLIPEGNGEDTLQIQVKDEEKGWDTNAYLFLHEDRTWSWTEDFHSGSQRYEKANDTLKDFVKSRRNQAGGENARYSIYDVYSPSELGVFVRD